MSKNFKMGSEKHDSLLGVIRDVKQGRGGKRFSFDTPYTPHELTSEIIDQLEIHKDSRILVMFTLEFAVNLIDRGFTDVTVTTDKYCAITEFLCKKTLGIRYCLLPEIEEQEMKFDVIIGNPPFNDSPGDNRTESKNTNNSNLFFEFIKKCLDIVNNGQVVLITPAAWMNKGEIKQKVIDAGLRKIKEVDPKHFPKVGVRSGISCLFTETGYDGDIRIETSGTVYDIDRHSILTFDNPDKFSLINRINKGPSFATLLDSGPYAIPKGTKGSIPRLLEKDSSFAEKPDSEHPYKVIIYAGGKNTPERYLFNSSNKSKDKWGVVVPTASDKYIIGAVRIIEPGVGVSDRLKVAYFDSQHEAENVKKYLDSKLIQFIVGTTKYNDTVNTNKNSFGNIPLINFTRSYTDNELFSLFNLSDKDINLVNS